MITEAKTIIGKTMVLISEKPKAKIAIEAIINIMPVALVNFFLSYLFCCSLLIVLYPAISQLPLPDSRIIDNTNINPAKIYMAIIFFPPSKTKLFYSYSRILHKFLVKIRAWMRGNLARDFI